MISALLPIKSNADLELTNCGAENVKIIFGGDNYMFPNIGGDMSLPSHPKITPMG